MNSIKSLAILTLLAIVSLFLYWKINEKEAELPSDAADLSFDDPQIRELEPGMDFGESSASHSAAPPRSMAPPFDPRAVESTAPAWNAQMGSQLDSQALPPAEDVPPPTHSNPFLNRDSETSIDPSGSVEESGSQNQLPPNASALLPPGESTNDMEGGMPAGRVDVSPPNADPSLSTEPVSVDSAPATADGITDPSTDNHSGSSTVSYEASEPPASADPSWVPDSSGQPGELVPGVPEAPSAVSIETTSVTPLTIARKTTDELLAEGNYAQALRFLSDYYGEPSLSPEEQEEITTLVSQLAGTVIYSNQHLIEPAHVVQPGETLNIIAARYNVPAELLAKINGLSTSNPMQPGTQLKVVRGPFSAIVDLGRSEMRLMLDGRYAGRFPIGIGTDAPNLEGTWIVATKEINPVYHMVNQSVAGGDPSNPLGDRILVLYAPTDNRIPPIGIHGSPATSGFNDPRGYIRLSSADVADVFDILSVGSQVVVRK